MRHNVFYVLNTPKIKVIEVKIEVKYYCSYINLYKICKASILKHMILTSPNSKDNISNSFVLGKCTLSTGLSLYI